MSKKILILLAMTLITERTLLDTVTSTRYICYKHMEGNGGYMEAEKIGTMLGDKWLGSFANYQECLDKLKQMEKYE